MLTSKIKEWPPGTIIILFLVVACNEKKQQSNNTGTIQVTQAAIPKKELSENSSLLTNDAIIVEEKSAVFVFPDSLRIEKRKKEIGAETFFSGADDYAFYINNAAEFLDSVKMNTIDARGKRFIKFVHKNNSSETIKLEILPELWEIYFFDPRKKAIKIDMTNIEESYKKYFTN